MPSALPSGQLAKALIYITKPLCRWNLLFFFWGSVCSPSRTLTHDQHYCEANRATTTPIQVERTLPDSLQGSAVWNCIALGAAEGGETEPLKHLCWLLWERSQEVQFAEVPHSCNSPFTRPEHGEDALSQIFTLLLALRCSLEKEPGAPTLSFKSHSIITKLLLVFIFLNVLSVLMPGGDRTDLRSHVLQKRCKKIYKLKKKKELRMWMGCGSDEGV